MKAGTVPEGGFSEPRAAPNGGRTPEEAHSINPQREQSAPNDYERFDFTCGREPTTIASNRVGDSEAGAPLGDPSVNPTAAQPLLCQNSR